MANQNSILLSNDFETLDSLNRNTDTISASVSHTTPKLTSLIHKHACLANNNEYHTEKGYYFYKYYKPSDPKGYYPLIYGLKLHLKREHDIDWIIAENKSCITL